MSDAEMTGHSLLNFCFVQSPLNATLAGGQPFSYLRFRSKTLRAVVVRKFHIPGKRHYSREFSSFFVFAEKI